MSLPDELPPTGAITLSDLLLDTSLANELISVGLEDSRDLWILALCDQLTPHSKLGGLLRRVSQDISAQWDTMGLYHSCISFSSQVTTPDRDTILDIRRSDPVREMDTVRAELSMKVRGHLTILWQAVLSESHLPHDSSSLWLDQSSVREACSDLVSKQRTGVIQLGCWAVPAADSWNVIRPYPDIEQFRRWLNSPKLLARNPYGDRNRSILKQRLGLHEGRRRTLEDLGQEFGLTRERIRQIADKALVSLCHPSTRKHVRAFEVTLVKLLKRHGGAMTMSEITTSKQLLIDYEEFWPTAVIELVLYGFSSFVALDYDYPTGSGCANPEQVTWYLKDRMDDSDIKTSRTAARSLVTRDPAAYSRDELVEKVSAESGVELETVRASLRSDGSIVETSSGLMVPSIVRDPGTVTIATMVLSALRDIGVPEHFTAIRDRIRMLFPEKSISLQYVGNCLVDNPLFRWVDRGTYGLAEWGLPEIRPKESYARGKKLVERALREIGRPATVREIDDHLVSLAAKNPQVVLLSKTSILLANNPRLFVSLGFAKWALTEWNLASKSAKDTVSLACEILAEGGRDWLTLPQMCLVIRSRGLTVPTPVVRRALERELSRPDRRLRREELHGFSIHLYGLSSSHWSEQAVLEELLSD